MGDVFSLGLRCRVPERLEWGQSSFESLTELRDIGKSGVETVCGDWCGAL
jgi:hypothetical protein